MAFDGSTISTATTATFVAGVFTDTFILSAIDVDMVAITLTAGNLYQIDIDNGVAGDFHLRIFDAFGIEVRANDDGFRTNDDVLFQASPWIEFSPNYSGTYYVAVSPYYMQGYNPKSLAGRTAPENPIATTAGTLTITDFGTNMWPSAFSINSIFFEDSQDETDMFREEDGSLRVSYTGSVDFPTDVDIARIDLAKGDVVVIDVNGLQGNGTVLRVFDDNGVQIGLDDFAGFGTDPELLFAAPVLDDYYIGITGDGNATYNALDGTGTVAGVIGNYEVIVHRNPTMIGSSAVNVITSDVGADYIVSLGGNDTLNGNDGNDTLAGGDDQDSLRGGNGNDQLYGEQGDDTLAGDGGNDVVSGGLGNDVANGGLGDDLIEGGTGNDTLLGAAGNDTQSGGDGNDRVIGLAGNDVLNGDAGEDTLFGGTEDDALFGNAGLDRLLGEAGSDRMDGADGDDQLFGGTEDDSLDGGLGNDTLNGGTGDDALAGGLDNDLLLGAAGNDRLAGDAGNDVLTGGGNDDAFVFTSTANGVDTITDFNLGSADVINLVFLFGLGVVNAGNLSQYIQTSTSGVADSFLAVDADGLTGGLNFTIIAQVKGVTAAQLFDIANFVL